MTPRARARRRASNEEAIEENAKFNVARIEQLVKENEDMRTRLAAIALLTGRVTENQ